MQAWKEGKIGVPTDELTGQLGSRAVDHRNWMRADMNTYEIEYEEVCFSPPPSSPGRSEDCIGDASPGWLVDQLCEPASAAAYALKGPP